MKNKVFYILIAIIALFSLWLIIGQRVNDASNGKSVDTKLPRLEIGGKTIFIEMTKSEEERTRGLSGRKSLNKDSGMFFAFDKPDFYYFWMKDMNFPIDIVWFNENYQIVDITKNFSEKSYPKTVTSKEPSKFILEVNANYADILGLKIGDMAKLLTN